MYLSELLEFYFRSFVTDNTKIHEKIGENYIKWQIRWLMICGVSNRATRKIRSRR
jgi:hypothetical protein